MIIKTYKYLADIDFFQLMEVYQESNLDNVDYLYLNEPVSNRLPLIIEGFRQYVRQLLKSPTNRYFIMEQDGQYRCAVRLHLTDEDGYIVEGLETPPPWRNQGYATEILRYVLHWFARHHPGAILFSPHITNPISLTVHLKAGFTIQFRHEDGSVSVQSQK